jgi:hypothetical protein
MRTGGRRAARLWGGIGIGGGNIGGKGMDHGARPQ